MNVKRIEPKEWAEMGDHAHRACFNEQYPAYMQRIDYALLCVDALNNILGYVTVRELDHETVYWQYGGAFPGTRKTVKSFEMVGSLITWVKERYKRITMLIENTNTAMLKMAMSYHFKIVGVRIFKNSVLVEHLLEF